MGCNLTFNLTLARLRRVCGRDARGPSKEYRVLPKTKALIRSIIELQDETATTQTACVWFVRAVRSSWHSGQLFYDASHQPCVFGGGKVVERHSPERRSILPRTCLLKTREVSEVIAGGPHALPGPSNSELT